jgi:GDPmannose 4,6-dehydratase
MKKALVLGCTGQDGSYCVDFLLKKKYQVHGLIRKSATNNKINIQHLVDSSVFNKNFFLHKGDLLDFISLESAINESMPDEIYNFADQDKVVWSHDIPIYSNNVTASSVIQILEILRKRKNKIKFFQPVSSNIFGLNNAANLNENTTLNPASLYALAKCSAFLSVKMYSKIYKIFGCGAIYFNHESPRRGEDYVTKKIVKSACDIYLGKKKFLELGDISIKIDWGYAPDYVEAAWKIMQLPSPDFYIIGSGKAHTVEYFARKTFAYLGLNLTKYLKINKKLIRPNKTKNLIANTSKAFKAFGFKNKTSLDEIIKEMVDAELSVKK